MGVSVTTLTSADPDPGPGGQTGPSVPRLWALWAGQQPRLWPCSGPAHGQLGVRAGRTRAQRALEGSQPVHLLLCGRGRFAGRGPGLLPGQGCARAAAGARRDAGGCPHPRGRSILSPGAGLQIATESQSGMGPSSRWSVLLQIILNLSSAQRQSCQCSATGQGCWVGFLSLLSERGLTLPCPVGQHVPSLCPQCSPSACGLHTRAEAPQVVLLLVFLSLGSSCEGGAVPCLGAVLSHGV